MRFTTGRLPLEHPATPPLVVTNQHDAVPDYAQSSSTDQRKCFTPLLLEDALRYANFLRLASFGVLVLGPEQTNKRSSFLSISQSVSQSASQSPGVFPPPAMITSSGLWHFYHPLATPTRLFSSCLFPFFPLLFFSPLLSIPKFLLSLFHLKKSKEATAPPPLKALYPLPLHSFSGHSLDSAISLHSYPP